VRAQEEPVQFKSGSVWPIEPVNRSAVMKDTVASVHEYIFWTPVSARY
jgi:hypothetical protein